LKTNRFWLIILAGAVIVSAVTALLLGKAPAEKARIFKDGILLETIDLAAVNKPYTIEVDSNGRSNVIEVERGRIRMQTADCPDGTCVRTGWISRGVTPIVCLPHRLVIELESSDKDIDAQVG